MERTFDPGQLVVSVCGRDRGKFYLVLEATINNMVLVVDGEVRKVASPKKKNVRHLRPCQQKNVDFLEKVNSGRKITDLDVRKALKEMLGTIEGN